MSETDGELTKEQLDRQYEVDGLIQNLFNELAGKELTHDVGLIGKVRDVIQQEFADKRIMSEMDFYPWLRDWQADRACRRCGGNSWSYEANWHWQYERWEYGFRAGGGSWGGQQVKQDGHCVETWTCNTCEYTQNDTPGLDGTDDDDNETSDEEDSGSEET